MGNSMFRIIPNNPSVGTHTLGNISGTGGVVFRCGQSSSISFTNENGTNTFASISASGGLTAGGLSFPITNGTSGQVLTSDGAGNVTWGSGGGTSLTLQDITTNGSETTDTILAGGFNSRTGYLGSYYTNVELDSYGIYLGINGSAAVPAEVRFGGQTVNDWVGFKGSLGYTGQTIWTLPGTDGSNGQALTTDGNKVLSWTTVGGLLPRQTASATTALIGNNVSANLTIAAAKTYALLKIQTSAAAWVTLYTDTASRTADAGRTENTDALPGSGVIAEVITGGAATQLMTPGVFGFNNDATPSTNVYVKVVNKSGSNAAITVTLTYTQLEV